MPKSASSNEKGDGPLELVGLVLVILAVVIFLIWMAGSTAIVRGMTPVLLFIGSAWQWLPGDLGVGAAISIYEQAIQFQLDPAKVGFFEFAGFANLAFAPASVLLTFGVLVWLIAILFLPGTNVYRRFRDADRLMAELSTVFTGTAPILHIRKDIAKHADPLWARQTFPEEVLLKGRIDGKPLTSGSPQTPMEMEIHLDRVDEWLRGFDAASLKKASGGRKFSSMLGHQMVNLVDPADRARFKRVPKPNEASFADRFSDVGKVMFGMLCAHAFGGAQGVKDAHVAKDQLNNSCRGAPHGLPNLKVAQWIFDKYRCNELAHKLFAVHHWEYTYLFELFVQAKRWGKFPDSEFRWLKPSNRRLWYVLNTVGRFTPHAESSTAFFMHPFERMASRMSRLPLRITAQGDLEHSVVTQGAMEGLQQAWDHWRGGIEENDDDWWKDKDQWVSTDGLLNEIMKAPPLPDASSEAAQQMLKTDFDAQQALARSESEAKGSRSLAQAASDLMAGNEF